MVRLTIKRHRIILLSALSSQTKASLSFLLGPGTKGSCSFKRNVLSTKSAAFWFPKETRTTTSFLSPQYALVTNSNNNNNKERRAFYRINHLLQSCFHQAATNAQFGRRRPFDSQESNRRKIRQRAFFSSLSFDDNNMKVDIHKDDVEGGDKATNILRIALCQFPVVEQKEVNFRTAEDYIDRAVSMAVVKPDIIVLPEVWNSPYATAAFPENAEVLPTFNDLGSTISSTSSSQSPSADLLRSKAIEHQVYIVGGSIPENDNGLIYNTCLVFDPLGNIVTKHRKVHLFDVNVPGGIQFRESDTLTSGNTFSYFTYDGRVNIGIGICYDIRFPEYAMTLCQKYKCTVLIYPGAFNMTTGPAHWELLQRARANDNQCYVVTTSPARAKVDSNQSNSVVVSSPPKFPPYTAWGHSSVVGPWGDVIATCSEEPNIVHAEMDLEKVQQIRESIPISYQKRNDMYSSFN